MELVVAAVGSRLFEGCTAREIGQLMPTSRAVNEATNCPALWRLLYSREQCVPNSTDQPTRPEDEVGWRCEVYEEESNRWLVGTVVSKAGERLLVDYGSNAVRWEADLRHTGPWHARGKSRFRFLAEEKERRSEEYEVPAPEDDLPAKECWRSEYEQNELHLPRRCINTLRDHSDEVLDLQFTRSGLQLATCSRDLRLIVYDVLGTESSTVHFRVRHVVTRGACVCRVSWSPSDERLLLACTEEPLGNPFGQLSRVELWLFTDDKKGASLIGSFPSTPFDVHACWLDDDRFVTGDGLEVQQSSYRQTLKFWSARNKRELASLAIDAPLIDSLVNFAHLVQVAKDGSFVSFATGASASLVHRACVVALPKGAGQLTNEDRRFAKAMGREIGHSLYPPPDFPCSPSKKKRSFSEEGNFEDEDTDDEAPVLSRRMEALKHVEAHGAILSLGISHDHTKLLLNVRPFLQQSAACSSSPDIASRAVLQVWDIASMSLVFELGGHVGFTTKQCPFLLFVAQSGLDDASSRDYVASGSEDHDVYVWHLRHRRLVRVLRGHSDVVSAVAWNPKINGLLASASDDHTVKIWG